MLTGSSGPSFSNSNYDNWNTNTNVSAHQWYDLNSSIDLATWQKKTINKRVLVADKAKNPYNHKAKNEKIEQFISGYY